MGKTEELRRIYEEQHKNYLARLKRTPKSPVDPNEQVGMQATQFDEQGRPTSVVVDGQAMDLTEAVRALAALNVGAKSERVFTRINRKNKPLIIGKEI